MFDLCIHPHYSNQSIHLYTKYRSAGSDVGNRKEKNKQRGKKKQNKTEKNVNVKNQNRNIAMEYLPRTQTVRQQWLLETNDLLSCYIIIITLILLTCLLLSILASKRRLRSIVVYVYLL